LPSAVTLGGGYDGGRVSPIGLLGHVFGVVDDGRLAAAATVV